MGRDSFVPNFPRTFKTSVIEVTHCSKVDINILWSAHLIFYLCPKDFFRRFLQESILARRLP